MSKEEKLLNKLFSRPKDMSFEELETLLRHFGYCLNNKGMTSGSRVVFKCRNHGDIKMHKPHSNRRLLPYQIEHVINSLREEKLL